jgi:hypothetical protein
VIKRRVRATRRPPAGAVQQTICVLPWLSLDRRTSFGAVSLDQLNNVLGELPPDVALAASRIAAGFRDLRGQPVDVSLCWLRDREPTAEMSEAEVDTLRDYVLLAMFAAIAENEYLSYREQINASHFQRVYQNFMPGTDTVALVFRRRDGRTVSGGWRVDELRFGAPAAVHHRPSPRWKQPLLDAIATCIGADDQLSARILDSVIWFFQGSEIDEFERHSEDVIFVVSALEQLCGTRGRHQDIQMATAIINLLGAEWSVDAKRSVRQWMAEAYQKRSELHGGRAARNRWPYWGHALLGTTVYCLMVKALLAAAGRYEMDGDDALAIEAFPARINCITLGDDDDATAIANCWNAARGEGAMRRARRRALEDILRRLHAEKHEAGSDT